MPIPAGWKRCKNCRTAFEVRKPGQVFCKPKCRTEFHNYGATPLVQLKRRLNAYMRSEEFKLAMRSVVRRELKAIMEEPEMVRAGS
jgi:hypothetical protein